MLVWLITAPTAWLVGESAKIAVSKLQRDRSKLRYGNYGGVISTHSTIVSAITALVGVREGISSPIFGVAAAFAFIVVIDAVVLRRQLGHYAAAINQLMKDRPNWTPLRERVGHSPSEIVAGLLLGSSLGALLGCWC